MNKEGECIICNRSAEMTIENSNAYIKDDKYKIYYCRFCNTSFAWPHIVNNVIYNYIYANPEIVPGYFRYALYAKKIKDKRSPLDYLADKESMYYAVKKVLRSYDRGIKILEVGSGLGYLTFAIAKEGYDISGLDISPDAVKEARKKFGDYFICEDVSKYAEEHSELFDLVILTEVIEHVPDPISFCKILSRLLKQDGKVMISTPNKSAYPPQEYWYTELPPVHLTWFSEESFLEISRQIGLKASFFDFTNFNKRHLDITKYIFAESYFKKRPICTTLNADGSVIHPRLENKFSVAKKLKLHFKKAIRFLADPIVINFLTDKKNSARNAILFVILSKEKKRLIS